MQADGVVQAIIDNGQGTKLTILGMNKERLINDTGKTGSESSCMNKSEVRRLQRYKDRNYYAGTYLNGGKTAANFCFRIDGKFVLRNVTSSASSIAGRDATGTVEGGAYGLFGGAKGTNGVSRYDKAAKPKWAKLLAMDKTARLESITSLSDASAVAAGEVGAVDERDGLVVRVDVTGALKWQTKVDGGADEALFAVRARQQGDVVFAGVRHDNIAVYSHFFGAMSATGKVAWTRAPAQPDLGSLDTITVLADDSLAMSGSRVVEGLERSLLVRTDGVGIRWWDRVFSAHYNDAYKPQRDALHAFADGSLFLGASGNINGGKYRRFYGIYTDPLGFASCNGPGKCLAKVGNGACDDSNPCTIDWCDADKGCQNTASAGTVCGEGKVCSEGKCAAK